MTPKDKTKATMLDAGYDPQDVVEAVASSDLTKLAPKPVLLHGMTAEAVLLLLRALKAKGVPVVVEAPVGSGDETVVDGHAYGGARVGWAWHFTAKSLAMACRVAGWSKVEQVEPGKLRLS